MSLVVQSARLNLVSLTPPVLHELLAGNESTASVMLGLRAPFGWGLARDVLELRLRQLEAEAEFQPWSLRVIVWRDTQELVGDIGCHTMPGPEYLSKLAPGGVEIGYGVLPSWRRQGIALEAARAFMQWAVQTHGVRRFVVSISPQNQPSLALAGKLGFRKIGWHLDEHDGPEDILELELNLEAGVLDDSAVAG